MTDVSKSPERIAGMFDAIAGRYDFLNHLLSAGIDRRWRRRAIASLELTGSERVLDLCTGNGSLAVIAAMAYPDVTVDAADISDATREVARGLIPAERTELFMIVIQSRTASDAAARVVSAGDTSTDTSINTRRHGFA